MAALTTSLPETPGGERNWDYRYTWIRDTTFTLQALHYMNLDWEANEFMQFVADLEPNADGALQIMYGIDGQRDLTETTREDLGGYEGARPVRIGNGAFDQRQNDVFGAVLDSLLLHTTRSKHLPLRLWPLVRSQAACATAVWREPDQGIWEARGEPQHYVSSKLMGWVALDRAARLAEIRNDEMLSEAVAGDCRRDPGRHPDPRRQRARGPASALRHGRPRRLHPAGPAVRLPAGHRRADPHPFRLPRRSGRVGRDREAVPTRSERRDIARRARAMLSPVCRSPGCGRFRYAVSTHAGEDVNGRVVHRSAPAPPGVAATPRPHAITAANGTISQRSAFAPTSLPPLSPQQPRRRYFCFGWRPMESSSPPPAAGVDETPGRARKRVWTTGRRFGSAGATQRTHGRGQPVTSLRIGRGEWGCSSRWQVEGIS